MTTESSPPHGEQPPSAQQSSHSTARSVLYYAPGDGLGHLSRAARYLNTFHPEAHCILISHSKYLSHTYLNSHLPRFTQLLPLPSTDNPDHGAWRMALESLIEAQKGADVTLCLDVFPFGLFGELIGLQLPKEMPVEWVCRRLKWSAYAQHLQAHQRIEKLPPPLSTRLEVVALEPLEAEQLAWISQWSLKTQPASLDWTPWPSTLTPELQEALLASPPPWLVLHSGPLAELEALVGYAHDQRELEGHGGPLWLITPERLPLAEIEQLQNSLRRHGPEPHDSEASFRCFAQWPAHALFPHAHRMITGCGYNLMHELEFSPQAQEREWPSYHRFLPFPRQFDDQFWRAARLRHPSPPLHR